tara:strand:+ start:87 stop:530 length:444 start_codon:yes stop_codon:yes gene_type:complete
MDLPFELYKGHKKHRKCQWKKSGLIMDNFEEIYDRYIHSKCCESCDKIFIKSFHRIMDHDHNTGLFRNVVCHGCNALRRQVILSNTGYQHISKVKNCGYSKEYLYRVNIKRNKKDIFSKRAKTLEEAIIFRDNFIKENPKSFNSLSN